MSPHCKEFLSQVTYGVFLGIGLALVTWFALELYVHLLFFGPWS